MASKMKEEEDGAHPGKFCRSNVKQRREIEYIKRNNTLFSFN